MAQLYFKVQSDYDKVIRLREEIKRLKDELNNVDTSSSMNGFNALNSKLQATTKEYNKEEKRFEREGVSLCQPLCQ
jgi:flagellin-like hook-associated protein FlgL